MSGERREVTIVIDGREISAVEGEMLHDAAKRGDVEIPVFCYEPKLGAPVGACRMCLVEIEGIPKLQTSCSTPVRDGMVVHTRTDQVKDVQSAVVEFLLVNHPLDCPVCDKGGECPLQDISMGWGPGKSRVTDPKRHFQKPLPLSPLVAIDRERCIMCYRCVRFSQEVAEDAQLQLLERGDRSFVGTFDDRPYVAPFHGNITDLCPVGALTNYTYRFRARPWDIEQAGSICTLCPSQCNISFTVRDEQVRRVIPRDNPGVDDGWLCDRGRYGFAMFNADERIRGPRVADGTAIAWDEAIAKAAEALRGTGAATAAIVGDASNEEGYLVQRLLREALGSPHVDSTPGHGGGRRALVDINQPALAAGVSDIDAAEAILLIGADPFNESPILDLRIRKAVRRNGAKLLVASERPTRLDAGAAEVVRYVADGAGSFLADLTGALRGGRPEEGSRVVAEGTEAIAERLKGAARVIVIWGEAAASTNQGAELLALGEALDLGREGCGWLEIPTLTNARGLREVGCLPDAGPGLAAVAAPGTETPSIPAAIESGEIRTLLLFGVDPTRDFRDAGAWERALDSAETVIAFSMFENGTTASADLVFPLESHAEKEGTVTHPDGRLQRIRPNAARPGAVRPGWQVLAELSAALGEETGIDSQPAALAAVSAAVPFYAGIDDAAIGGRGVRWQEREAAAAFPGATADETADAGEEGRAVEITFETSAVTASHGEVRSGDIEVRTYRDIWAGPITELNPPLRFLRPEQRLELSPADAERLKLASGDAVRVSCNGTSLEARVAVSEAMRDGCGFMIAGTGANNANTLPSPPVGPFHVGPILVNVEKLVEASA